VKIYRPYCFMYRNWRCRVIKLDRLERPENEPQKKPERPLKKSDRSEPTKKPEREGQKDYSKKPSGTLGKQPDIRVSFTDLSREGESIGQKQQSI